MSVSPAAKCSAALFALLGMFQLALVAGAPWGAAAWGGKNTGVLPSSFRAASVASLALAFSLAGVISGRIRVPFRRTRVLNALLVFSVVSIAMNAASRSSMERLIWVPYGVVQFTTIWVARRQEGAV